MPPSRSSFGAGSDEPAIPRWDRRYREAIEAMPPGTSDAPATVAAREPHPFLLEHAGLLPAEGRALDIASGLGRNSVWLARRALRVVAVDGSRVACDFLAGRATLLDLPIDVVCRDLEREPLPDGPFDVVVDTLYLQRDLAPRIEEALAPGGLLLFATYLEAGVAGRAPARFGLRPRELVSMFAGLTTLAYVERDDTERPWAGLAARKLG